MKGHLTKEGGTDAAEAIMTTDTVKKKWLCRWSLTARPLQSAALQRAAVWFTLIWVLCSLCYNRCGCFFGYAAWGSAWGCWGQLQYGKRWRRYIYKRYPCYYGIGQSRQQNDYQQNEDYYTFLSGLTAAFRALAKKLAGDGEGATKLLVCKVEGAKSKPNAVKIAKSIIGSSLVKAAMFGSDANWGRVLCAIGYSGADVDVKR